MTTELTDRFLRNLTAPEAGRLEISDAKRKGLRFRLSASGQGVWMYEKRVKGGPKRKHTLGKWPSVSLAEARSAALEIEAESAKGIDRVAETRARKEREEAARAGLVTVSEAIDAYERLHLTANLRTAQERRRQLLTCLHAHMGRPIGELKRADVQSMVDAKAKDGKPFAANRIRAALSAFFKWAWKRGYLDTDIGSGIARPFAERARERVLSVDEVRLIYDLSNELGPLWCPLVRLLILTGQRRGDIGNLRWSEIDWDLKRISLAGSRTKNNRPHITPLSGAALEQIEIAHRYQIWRRHCQRVGLHDNWLHACFRLQ